jgi:hypothetical protein
MDVTIKHVIGTIALIGLIITAGLAYTIITSYIETDIIKQQLKQIAENVALNIVEIVNLVNFANVGSNATLMKVLGIPSDLGGKAYAVQLVNETSQGSGCYVYIYLVSRMDVAASSSIPLNSTQTQLVLATDSEGTLLVRGNETIQYSGVVYGGAKDIVVWGWKGTGATWTGIGLSKSTGE